jgi:hypothetical protein
MKTYVHLWYLTQLFLEWEIFQIKVVEKIKTHILCSKTFYSRNRAVYEIMWKKYGTARQATDDNIIRRMRFACWIIKATDTHLEYWTFIAFPQQQWLRERASLLRVYIRCLCWSLSPCPAVCRYKCPMYHLAKHLYIARMLAICAVRRDYVLRNYGFIRQWIAQWCAWRHFKEGCSWWTR